MSRFFDLDSPIIRFLSRMADIIILNLLVMVTSIPIITIGASMSAMHYVLIKMVKNEENYIMKMYFKSFKENFVQGTLLWLIELVVLGVFVGDFYILTHSDVTLPWVVTVAIFAVGVIVLMTAMYIFPLQARFVNTIRGTLKNSFFMMILNFPKSILMFILYFLPLVLLYISDYAMPFLIMFGIAAPGLGAAYLYKKVFERFEPQPEAVTADEEFSVSIEEDYEDTREQTEE